MSETSYPLMKSFSVANVFKKAGLQVIPPQPAKLSPEQIKRQQEVTDAINAYIKRLQRAREASKNSTLVFKAQCQHKKLNPLNIQKQR